MTDWTLKHEGLCNSSSHPETQCKLTVGEKEHQPHRTSQLCLQYWMKKTYTEMYATIPGQDITSVPKPCRSFWQKWYRWRKESQRIGPRHMSSGTAIATGLVLPLSLSGSRCSLKTIGGLSHRRKWSEAQQFTWLLSEPTCAEYNQPSETQKRTSVSFLSSD